MTPIHGHLQATEILMSLYLNTSEDPPTNSFCWRDVRCTISSGGFIGKKGEGVEVLHGVSGGIHSHEMIAVVGPSGAGKTSLLDVLCMRKSVGVVTGDIVYNGKRLRSRRKLQILSSYVQQTDAFHPTQTVLEAVLFQADMRLDPYITKKEKVFTAKGLIAMAGLEGKENRRVGGILPGGLRVPGLSGGEKRRLSLCCAMVTNPRLLFVDEPTSGLDSLAALMIMRLLRAFCSSQGLMAICTIHQPRHAIWTLFDKIMVLGKGHQLFYGTPSESEKWFTADLGLVMPPSTTLVDFIMDTCNIDFNKSDLLHEYAKTFRTVDDLKQVADSFRARHPHIFGGAAEDLSISLRSRFSSPTNSSTESLPHTAAAAAGGLYSPSTDQDEEEGSEAGFSIKVTDHTTFLEGVESKEDRVTSIEIPGPPSISHLRSSSSYHCSLQKEPSWWFKYRTLLKRNGKNYLRNYGNVWARMIMVMVVGVFIGLVNFKGLPRNTGADIFNGLFFEIFTICLLPFCSQSGFLYDREFFQTENAAELYPASAYYAANMTLEFFFNTINGVLYGTIVYCMVDYASFIRPYDPFAKFAGFVSVMALANLLANVFVVCAALASPNQEIAFLVAATYLAISTVTGGVVSGPALYPGVSFLQYGSMVKYLYQALLLTLFADNSRAYMPMHEIVEKLGFNTPPTAWQNVVILLGFYSVFLIGGILCLKFLYKEKR